MAIKTLRIHFGHGPPWPLVTTRGQQISSAHPSPQLKGDSSHSSMQLILKVSGVVYIWYYIALCRIFVQQFNGDVFRTKFHDSKSRSQNPTPILKWDSSAHQTGNPWRLSEDYSRTPTTWL
ncbi:hypothetical protein O181_122676 [Austropuccinia psidii MF-1]|uniref:Uncharacterized protein n=1 Tax=Austropuccinia psidii MF-1 TaxID=1389203 RepID=A0A9Q3KLZ9_9BASI|nr:hypothetical protein [Austropuccinia psidii MF-1]